MIDLPRDFSSYAEFIKAGGRPTQYWTILSSDEMRKILLMINNKPVSVYQIRDELNIKPVVLSHLLRRMIKSNHIQMMEYENQYYVSKIVNKEENK